MSMIQGTSLHFSSDTSRVINNAPIIVEEKDTIKIHQRIAIDSGFIWTLSVNGYVEPVVNESAFGNCQNFHN